jgi:hypothetical protein
LIDPVQRLLNDLDRLADEDADLEDEQAADPRESVAWLQAASAEQISLLLQELLDRQPPGNAATDGFLAVVFQQLMLRQHGRGRQLPPLFLDESLVVLIAAVYRHLEPASTARELLPLLLSGVRSPRALVELADLLVDDPPRNPTLVAAAWDRCSSTTTTIRGCCSRGCWAAWSIPPWRSASWIWPTS